MIIRGASEKELQANYTTALLNYPSAWKFCRYAFGESPNNRRCANCMCEIRMLVRSSQATAE